MSINHRFLPLPLALLSLCGWAIDLPLVAVGHSHATWQDHKGWIIFAVAALVAQAMTIAALLLHRRRKLIAEKALLASEQQYHIRLEAALENKRQYEAGWKLLFELSQRSPGMSERQICDQALDIAVQTTGSEIGYLHLLNDDQNTISLVTWNKQALAHCTANYERHYPLEAAGIWADCVRTRQTVIHNDYQNMQDKKTCPAGHAHLLRHMSSPVFDGKVIRMIVGVGNKAGNYVQEDSDQLQRVAAEVQKILQRWRTEHALHESEARFRFITDLSPGMVWVTDEHNQCTWVNTTWLNFTGTAMAQNRGTGWLSVVHPQDAPASLATFNAHFEARTPLAMEYRVRRHDGHYFWLLDTAQPRVAEDGEFKGYVGTCIDITERKETEAQREIFETFFSMSNDMMAITGKDGYLKQVNQAFARVLGYSEAELKAQPVFELIVPEDRQATRDQAQWQLQGGVTLGFENRYRCKDGSVRRLSWHGVSDKAREVRYSTARDVTELRAAQERLSKVGLAVAQTSQSVIITDISARIEYVNQAFCQVSGYSEDEVLGQNPRLLKSGLTPKATYDDMWRSLERGDTWQGEFTNRRKNGDHFMESVRISPVRQSDGRISHYLALKEDISEHKREAEAILQAKILLQRVIDSSPDSIFVKDQQHRYLLVNEAYAKSFDQAPSAMMGRCDTDFLPLHLCVGNPEKGVVGWHDDDDAVFRGETVHLPHSKLVTESSETRVFDLVKTPLRDAQQRIFGNLCYRRDITERVNQEQAQKALESRLQQAQKMELIGQLTGGIAHDFNNILASILGYTELLQMSAELQRKPQFSQPLQEILQAAIRAKELVAQLLTFSHKREVATQAIRIKPIVKEVLKLLGSTLPSTISVKIEIESGLPSVLISAVQLHQILMNLAVNARDAMAGRGTIELQVQALELDALRHCDACHQPFQGRYVRISVQDNGAGIAPENRLRIFDPFFTTKEAGHGSGLGLSVLHGIVHSAGGHIEVITALDVGTQFLIYLPAQALLSERTALALKDAILDNPVQKGARVLVVDDEASIVGFVTAFLEGLGCQVTGLTNAPEALRLFRDQPSAFDLVFTDQTMPYLTGAELARAMLAVRPELPIVMITGYSNAIDEETARQIGIRKFLVKPVPARVLMDAVTECLALQ